MIDITQAKSLKPTDLKLGELIYREDDGDWKLCLTIQPIDKTDRASGTFEGVQFVHPSHHAPVNVTISAQDRLLRVGAARVMCEIGKNSLGRGSGPYTVTPGDIVIHDSGTAICLAVGVGRHALVSLTGEVIDNGILRPILVHKWEIGVTRDGRFEPLHNYAPPQR